MFDGINQNTPYRWKRSAAAPHGRKRLLSPADMTRLSEHILRVTDVLCLSAVGLDVRPGATWVKRLLRGMRLSCKKLPHPYSQVLERAHSPALQEANTHRLFIKLCWLMDKHAVSADRAVNIDETSCRLLPVHQIGWAAAASNKLSYRDRTGKPRLSRSPSARQRTAGPTTTTILQLSTSLDDVLNPGKDGQAWILLWDMASIHASEATMTTMKAT